MATEGIAGSTRSVAILMLCAWGTVAVADQRDPRLEDLFERLHAAGDAVEASAFEHRIWQIWTASGDEELDARMARGVTAMNAGDRSAALVAFDALVEAAPDFAEAWNKRATLHYLLGNHAESMDDIARTLALEPRHFGALSGLALIHEAHGRTFEAVEALEKVRAIHPRMPHLDERIRHLLDAFGQAV